MKLREIQELLDAVVLTGHHHLDDEVLCGFGSDLMSDVLCYANDDAILLTGLTNRQVLNTAEMANMRCVIFVRNKKPSEELVRMAVEMDMLVMSTRLILFECCGILYQHGLAGANKR
jgi:predicted transcriptional regulator